MYRIYMDNGSNHIVTRRMIPYWGVKGSYISDIKNANIQLSYVHFSQITKLPKIVRIDGIYYDSETNYKSRNHIISQAHSIADGIIYQSNFSSIMVPHYLEKRKESSKIKVIYNGIDRDWVGNHIENPKNFNIVVSAIWRRHKRLNEIIKIFLEFVKTHNAILHVLGSLDRESNVYSHPKICYYKHVDYNKMKSIFTRANVSLHLSKRDSCPNTVIETIGAGIPVITTNACGGATDMIKMTDGCIICNGDADYKDIDPVPHYQDGYNKLPEKTFNEILIALENIYKDRRRVILPEKLTAKYMAEEYLNFIGEVLG